MNPGYSSEYILGYTNRSSENISVWRGVGQVSDVPIILCHGFLATSSQWYDQPGQNVLVARQAGYSQVVALGPDLGGASTWGNDDFIDSIDDALTYGAANHGTRTDRVALYGLSMGGLCLNWAWRNPEKVVACALMLPAVDLEGLHDRNPSGLAAAVETAYGGSAGYLAALPTHDPSHPDNQEIIAEIADRVRIWYSEDDTIIDESEVLAYAAATGVEATSMGSVGHTVVTDQQELVDWFIPRVWWG